MRSHGLFLCFIISFLLMPFAFAQAQWPTTVEDAIFVDFGLYPRLVVDPDDHSVYVVYLNTDDEILVKKYDQYGFPQWGGSAVVAAISANFGQVGITGPVVSDDSGGVILCWEDFRNTDLPQIGLPEESEIYIQRVDINGQVRYGPNGKRISGPASEGLHRLGDLKPDYHDGFVVAYFDEIDSSRSYCKRFDRQGSLLWERLFEVVGIDLCATDREGNIFINLFDFDENNRQKLDLQGYDLWPNTLIGIIPDGLSVRGGGAFSDGEGGVMGVKLETPGIIHINRVDADGNYAFGEGINIAPINSPIRFAPDLTGGIYINWSTFDGSFTTHLQRVTFNGTLPWGENEIITCIPPNCLGTTDIASDWKTGSITVWLESNNDSLNLKTFYAQRFDSLGNTLWDSTGVEFHTTPDDPTFIGPDIYTYSDLNGGAILVWIEQGQGLRIFIKQISCNGNLGEVITSLKPERTYPIPNKFVLYGNYPNPFNAETVVEFELFAVMNIQIDIFNLTGEKIRTLINQQLQVGNHRISWDGKGAAGNEISSGLYFYRIKSPYEVKTGKMLLVR